MPRIGKKDLTGAGAPSIVSRMIQGDRRRHRVRMPVSASLRGHNAKRERPRSYRGNR
jgi:hypothetical protein